MQTFLTFIKEFRIPKKSELKDAKASFSSGQQFIFAISILVAFITMVILVGKINSHFMVEVPTGGGSITEGIIGTPTLVNPVLSVSDADKDLSSLVYSGMMRKMSDGTLIPDLAESYSVSPDGMTYTFILKSDAKFQDGTAVTADDVIFTIDKIQDPLVKSPRKIGWDGVSVSKRDDKTVVFTLKDAYISFIDNTTIGILPMHIWKNISAQEFSLSALNIKPIGSGPYKIDSVVKNAEGVPTSFSLSRFPGFALGGPHVSNIRIVSYSNENELVSALLSHAIDAASGLSPENASRIIDSGYVIHTATLPRIFGMFYNSTNNKIFADPAVLKAIDSAIDRQEIIDKVLSGYATVTHSPVPLSILPGQEDSSYKDGNIEDAKAILDNAGWTIGPDGIRQKGGVSTKTVIKKVGKKTIKQTVQVNKGPITKLAFSITTGDTPELQQSAELLKSELGELGADIDIKVYEIGPLNQLIRSRNYEALFFGQIVNHESDLFSFWHSSQKTDPGLNIAMYSDAAADQLLAGAQKTLNRDDRTKIYQKFVDEFNKSYPAFLIYSPRYLYATKPDLSGTNLDTLTAPSDRFASIYKWYAESDHVWKIFTK